MRSGSVCVTAAALVAGSASAQPDMLITVDNIGGDDWRVSAEFLSNPGGHIVQVWADASFDLIGDGTDIAFTGYNVSYDTTLGPAAVTNGPLASFRGNANAFFGTPDSSNPLWVADFEYMGDPSAIRLDMVGQNSLIRDVAGGGVDLYQDADSNPGNFTWGVVYIPAPATLALAPLALVATRRCRK